MREIKFMSKILTVEEEKKLLSGKFNPINDFLPSETISNNFSRYTFDVRA